MTISDERLRKALLGAPYLSYAEQEIVIVELFVLRAENADDGTPCPGQERCKR